MSETHHRVMGLDLGQAADYSAAVVLERRCYDSDFVGPPYAKVNCVAIRRWPLNTDYNDVVKNVLDLPCDALVVDYTGVGRPVVDMLRRRAQHIGYRGMIRPVVIAASHVVMRQKTELRGKHWVVPKVDLVTSINSLQQRGLLALPRCPETQMLLDEMDTFKMRYTKRSLAFEGTKHDDLLMAAGLAAWWTLRMFSRRVLAVL